MLYSDRRALYRAAKSAVRAYEQDPSRTNAETLRSVWRIIQASDPVSLKQSDASILPRGDPADWILFAIKKDLKVAKDQGLCSQAQTELVLRTLRQTRPDAQPIDAQIAIRIAQQF